MAYEDLIVEEPVPCPGAFAETSEMAFASQAALLLALGSMWWSEWTGEGAFGRAEHMAAFPLPRLEPVDKRLHLAVVHDHSRERFGIDIREIRRGDPQVGDLLQKIAEELYTKPEPMVAGVLLALAVLHDNQLVATAAATTQVDAFHSPFIASSMLLEAARSDEPDVVQEIASAALARLTHPQGGVQAPPPSPPKVKPGSGLILVHGTMPPRFVGQNMNTNWWRPRGDLHEYLRQRTRPDIYARSDYFKWEGGYSDYARAEVAAENLLNWQRLHQLGGMDVVTHSHGGNMAMAATHLGLTVGKLLLLSCPVHWPQYHPAGNNFASAQSIRIRFDLVIFADRGWQSFPQGTIPDHFLPWWFVGHSDSRKSGVWQKQSLDRFL